jgi:hypothetical protein
MATTGLQLSFVCPESSAFRRLYDYKIRKINSNYSLDNGATWHPFRVLEPISTTDSIPFGATLTTYSQKTSDGFHPVITPANDIFKLKFDFEFFSNNSAFTETKVHNLSWENTGSYQIQLSEGENVYEIYHLDSVTNYPSDVSVVLEDVDVHT